MTRNPATPEIADTPTPRPSDMTKVGTSKGIAASTCDRTGPRIEQVYVYVAPKPEPHPIVIDGWVGYSVPARMMLTRSQAVDLIGLLAQALAS